MEAQHAHSQKLIAVNRSPYTLPLALIICLFAASISGYLAWVAYTSTQVVGCGSGGTFDCGHVLQSRWAKAAGIPVGALALGLYATAIGSLVFLWRNEPKSGAHEAASDTIAHREKATTGAWFVLTTCGISAALAALWFTGLQIFDLQHLCVWCLAAHGLGFVLCILLLITGPISGSRKMLAGLVAALGFSGLVTVQALSDPPETYEIVEFAPDSTEQTGAESAGATTDLMDAPIDDAPVDMAPPGDEPTDLAPTDDMSDLFDDPQASLRTSPVSFAAFQQSLLFLFSPSVGITTSVGDQPPAEGTQSKETAEPAKDSTDDAQGEETAPIVSVAQGRIRLNAKQWPIVGSPDAKYIFIEMYDYTCPNCRNTHKAIKGALEKYGSDLAVIMLPIPLNRQCNPAVTATNPMHAESCELSKLAIAVWRAKSESFAVFHEWMLTGPTAPSYKNAKAKAAELVGLEALEGELNGKTPAKYIEKNVELYGRMGNGTVPKLLFAKSALVGEVVSASALTSLIENSIMPGK